MRSRFITALLYAIFLAEPALPAAQGSRTAQTSLEKMQRDGTVIATVTESPAYLWLRDK
jgi:hypothetical protein